MCSEDLMIAKIISSILLCIQISVLILLWRRNNIRVQDKGFLCLLLIAHPIFWKQSDDCGEEVLIASILFVLLSVIIWRLALYRSSVVERVQHKENGDQE